MKANPNRICQAVEEDVFGACALIDIAIDKSVDSGRTVGVINVPTISPGNMIVKCIIKDLYTAMGWKVAIKTYGMTLRVKLWF